MPTIREMAENFARMMDEANETINEQAMRIQVLEDFIATLIDDAESMLAEDEDDDEEDESEKPKGEQ